MKKGGALTVFLFLLLLGPLEARGGEWRVSPIRLELGRDAKSGVITVYNEAEEPLQVQMKAYTWTQDGEGKDKYSETGDLLFFPRIMVFGKKEDRILRVGIKMPAAKNEKSYRLFIEEIPGPRKTDGVNISIAIRFGVPVFVKPTKEEIRGEIGKLAMTKGVLSIPVRNAGNAHFVIRSIVVAGENVKGEKVFSRDIGGWYLLEGASRVHTTEVPKEVCEGLARITAIVSAEPFSLAGELSPDKTMCEP
ncbi:MAG: fimbria/pilus periplasmic chaperone [Deltaproteobacteria bacterium]|nr:fimbria/pilus periplasmic chaperone [Deltaproteobacteria bacterium]